MRWQGSIAARRSSNAPAHRRGVRVGRAGQGTEPRQGFPRASSCRAMEACVRLSLRRLCQGRPRPRQPIDTDGLLQVAVAFAHGGRLPVPLPSFATRTPGSSRLSGEWPGKFSCVSRGRRYIREFHGPRSAGVAQLAEHRFCKPTVVSSTLTASSRLASGIPIPGAFHRVQRRRAKETAGGDGPRGWAGPSQAGWIPKWLKGPDCKSGGIAFAGSNPAPPILARLGRSDPANHPSTTPLPSSDRPLEPDASPNGLRRPPGGCNSMVEYLPSKQATWVRFPSPAFGEPDGRKDADRRGSL